MEKAFSVVGQLEPQPIPHAHQSQSSAEWKYLLEENNAPFPDNISLSKGNIVLDDTGENGHG